MTKDAEYMDLLLEVWFRTRNSGDLVWKTKTGEVIPVKDMSWSHLINTIKYLQKRDEEKEILSEYDAYISSHCG